MSMKTNEADFLIAAIDGVPLSRCQFGGLMPAHTYVKYFGTPRSGRPRDPVLVANCDLKDLQAAAGGRACFGFGRIQGPGFSVISIRFQIGSIQIYWLADASDVQMWKTIDAWRASNAVPVALVEAGMAMYSVHELDWIPGKSRSRTDDMRGECAGDNSAAFLSFAVGLASSGLLEEQATTDLEGIALSHVEVNVLITERLQQYFLPEPLSGRPMAVLPVTKGGPGRSTLH
ncbi:hypothetical protein [Paraburkholderia fungorum]|jgi:hypothetical protein|uniref:hypothetical protein n=2 Tax=Pseudomonadota TaxID=1224 RepID=UPI00041C1677|nr:hypothetical protein [Paraburkholderia fungorum]PZR48480.1 MAG: hypothetical protein DI523_10755 [Paraburkholderia fungorum]